MNMETLPVYYESFTDVLDALREDGGKDKHPSLGRQSRSTDNDDWAGGSWDQALDWFEHGTWKVSSKELNKQTQEAFAQLEDRLTAHLDAEFREVYDVAGSYVDVARFLDGEPECMVEQWVEEAPKKGKVIRVLANITYNFDIKGEVARRRGATLLAGMEMLHRMGFEIELWVGSFQTGTVNGETKQVQELIQVKRAGDPVDWKNVMFALANPTMLRRIVVGLNELRPVGQRNGFGFRKHGGYGSTGEADQETQSQFDLYMGSLRSNSWSPSDFIREITVIAEGERVNEYD